MISWETIRELTQLFEALSCLNWSLCFELERTLNPQVSEGDRSSIRDKELNFQEIALYAYGQLADSKKKSKEFEKIFWDSVSTKRGYSPEYLNALFEVKRGFVLGYKNQP